MEILKPEDVRILRDIAKRVDEIASQPLMAERRELWKRHNSMENVRPPVYVDPQGAWCELSSRSEEHTSELQSR